MQPLLILYAVLIFVRASSWEEIPWKCESIHLPLVFMRMFPAAWQRGSFTTWKINKVDYEVPGFFQLITGSRTGQCMAPRGLIWQFQNSIEFSPSDPLGHKCLLFSFISIPSLNIFFLVILRSVYCSPKKLVFIVLSITLSSSSSCSSVSGSFL